MGCLETMDLPLPLELVAAITAACLVLGLLRGGSPSSVSRPSRTLESDSSIPRLLRRWLRSYLLSPNWPQSLGLLLLRLAVGVMMIHHGQDKLSDPQSFATNYVAALHLPFPLLLAYAAGYAEILGSWLLIFGLFTPIGALALSGTMAVAAYHHIVTSGFNIYVLELVVLYLGSSVGLLLLGPGRISFDAGLAQELLAESPKAVDPSFQNDHKSRLSPVSVEASSL